MVGEGRLSRAELARGEEDLVNLAATVFVEDLDSGDAALLVAMIAGAASTPGLGAEVKRRILLGTLVAIGAYLSLTAVAEKLGITGLEVPGYISDPTVGIHFGRARGPFVDAGACA